ncbi:MAG: FkbM family methyltransferase [Verrucomicrobiota bacterium]|nr:FkbM family methyltransferase [Verrucomicrobiota bacterium]
MSFLKKKFGTIILILLHKLLILINRRTGLRYYRVGSNNNDPFEKRSLEIPTLPHGVDLHVDISKQMPGWDKKARVFVDVGSNIGDTAQEILCSYSNVRLYCFEPVLNTFEKLAQRFSNASNVNCVRLALSSSNGMAKMNITGNSEMFRIVSQNTNSTYDSYEEVEMSTLDHFCKKNEISHIHFLKIDTEGNDLEVLLGSKKYLENQKIDIIQVESGMHYSNDRHCSFEALKELLENNKYYLFGLYEQVEEWVLGKINLRRVNAVYISQNVLNSHN